MKKLFGKLRNKFLLKNTGLYPGQILVGDNAKSLVRKEYKYLAADGPNTIAVIVDGHGPIPYTTVVKFAFKHHDMGFGWINNLSTKEEYKTLGSLEKLVKEGKLRFATKAEIDQHKHRFGR